MDADLQWELLAIPVVALAFVVPAALFIVLRRRIPRTFLRLVCVVGFVWFTRVAFRVTIEVSICMAHAQAHGDFEYDGVGGNAGYLVLGWVEPLLACLVVIALTFIVRRFRRTKLTHSQEGSGHA